MINIGFPMVSHLFFWAPAAYLLGSVPFGKLISKKTAHIDITNRGSGNIGATNVAREVGIKWGFLTLILDVLKGFIPVILFTRYAPQSVPLQELGPSLVGLCALLGHQFSLFMKFRGGKGVGTALGLYLGVSPLCALLSIFIFLAMVFKWDFVSLGSLSAAAAMPILLAIFGKPLPVFIGAVIAASLISIKHQDNIHGLVNGKERKWRSKEGQDSISRRRSSSSSE
jgi:glycerol-3-phosphate acyltransferase PlsY